ncbi:hypothetical protein COC49_00635 [Bacillus cereus]|nr:hypothetical protein COC49_00635 [Bacillus cereus]
MFIYSFVLKIVYRNYIRKPHKQTIGDSRSKCFLFGLVGFQGQDIWAWLDRAWSCGIGGYIDIQE